MSSSNTSSPSISQKVEPFIVGGLSAMLASSCIHPIDLAKVRLQLFSTQFPTQPRPSFTTIISNIVKNEGVTAVYAGLSASLLRQAVYGTARIGLHRTISEEMIKKNGNEPLPFLLKTFSGMLSGSIAVCIGTPFDVSLVRMQADSMKPAESRRNYSNVFNALGRIIKEEGAIKLYSGILPNVLRGMAMNVGMMACYDQAAEMTAKYIVKEKSLNDDGSKPVGFTLKTQLIASLFAGFTASSFSLPFDMIKSRLRKLIFNVIINFLFIFLIFL